MTVPSYPNAPAALLPPGPRGHATAGTQSKSGPSALGQQLQGEAISASLVDLPDCDGGCCLRYWISGGLMRPLCPGQTAAASSVSAAGRRSPGGASTPSS